MPASDKHWMIIHATRRRLPQTDTQQNEKTNNIQMANYPIQSVYLLPRLTNKQNMRAHKRINCGAFTVYSFVCSHVTFQRMVPQWISGLNGIVCHWKFGTSKSHDCARGMPDLVDPFKLTDKSTNKKSTETFGKDGTKLCLHETH